EMSEARLRMTRITKGADLILNKVSGALGFWIGNVIVMAGVPSIMQAMLDEVAPQLNIGVRMLSETVRADVREGDIGMQLGEIAKANPEVAIGSYPFFDPQHGPNTNVVLRARDAQKLTHVRSRRCWSECGEHNQRVSEPIYIRLRIWGSGVRISSGAPLLSVALVARYRRCPRILDAITIVRPETVVRWHRMGFAAYWRWKSRPRGGRPRIDKEVRDLIRRMSLENPLWGATKIHGELLKLGIEVAQSTVSIYMVPRRDRPLQTWKTFLCNHME